MLDIQHGCQQITLDKQCSSIFPTMGVAKSPLKHVSLGLWRTLYVKEVCPDRWLLSLAKNVNGIGCNFDTHGILERWLMLMVLRSQVMSSTSKDEWITHSTSSLYSGLAKRAIQILKKHTRKFQYGSWRPKIFVYMPFNTSGFDLLINCIIT